MILRDVEDLIYKAAYGRRREILLILYSQGATSLNKLRSKLGVSSSALLFDISALEALGLIKRDGGLVELTDKGVKVASILLSVAPLRNLSILEALGLRPFVVPMLASPYLNAVTALLLIIWTASIYVSKSALIGIIYTYIFTNIYNILFISILSFIFILFSIYFTTHRRVPLTHIIIGLFPLLIYPSISIIIENYNILYALKFILLLLSCGTLSTVTSYDMGSKYETALLAYLTGMFVIPILVYLVLHVYI
ncbi:regulatory protein, ArsR [Thermoproteus uzoniensis 768-20]|uniref:Regulatory protein, ArsR n=1 Tax=Thermoproteus uzoniensis (strain 768-20) TaxID=999630 RepID=F2L3D1_THEU7|nr:regulatory protein, ArsR [Thermoproteus uzoniensis 768-20]